MTHSPTEIVEAGPERRAALGRLFGRAFVTEPMMRWPLGGHEDLEARLVSAFELFLEGLLPLGLVWEAGAGMGASVWISPDRLDAWEQAQMRDERVYSLTDDGGRRWDEFWAWVEARIPAEPFWHLDSVAVDPPLQGRGIGSALVRHGLARARADGIPAILETGSPRNVPLYERLGFRVVSDADAPGGGPHVWFMRCDG